MSDDHVGSYHGRLGKVDQENLKKVGLFLQTGYLSSFRRHYIFSSVECDEGLEECHERVSLT